MRKAIILLIFFTLTSKTEAAPAPEIVIQRVPPGYVVQEEGYFLNEYALSSLAGSASMHRQQSDMWEQSYYQLKETTDEYLTKRDALIATLEASIEAERKARDKELRKARRPGTGFYAGIGATYNFDEWRVGLSIGWGLVWKR